MNCGRTKTVFANYSRCISHFKTSSDTLLLLFALLCVSLFSQHASSQDLRDRSALKVYFPEEVFFCIQPSLELTPDSIIGGIAPYTYRWWSEDGVLSLADTLEWQGIDTTRIWLEVADSEGFRGRSSTLAIPYPLIPASFTVNQTQGCQPHEVEFRSDYLAFQHVDMMQWDFGTGDSATTLASAVHTYPVAGTFLPSLTITDNHGCRWRDTLNVELRVFPSPQASFVIEDSIIYLPHAALRPENTTVGAGVYNWDFGPWGQSQEDSPRFDLSADVEGTAELQLTATNAFGCASVFSQSIKVIRPISFYIPNAFSPDRDGINEEWLPRGNGVDASHYHLDVFDQWGTVIFSTEDLEQPWDGKNASTRIDVAPGMYAYRIIARDSERGVGHEFKGVVVVIR
jgi:gliding motility-associated-like protein